MLRLCENPTFSQSAISLSEMLHDCEGFSQDNYFSASQTPLFLQNKPIFEVTIPQYMALWLTDCPQSSPVQSSLCMHTGRAGIGIHGSVHPWTSVKDFHSIGDLHIERWEGYNGGHRSCFPACAGFDEKASLESHCKTAGVRQGPGLQNTH